MITVETHQIMIRISRFSLAIQASCLYGLSQEPIVLNGLLEMHQG